MLSLNVIASTLVLLLGLSALAALLTRKRTPYSSLPLPPGPKGLPVVGNLYDIPMKNMPPVFFEMSKKFGSLLHFEVFGKHTIVINSYDDAVALLESRSTNTSDRPQLVMADLTDLTYQFTLEGYTERWKLERRMFHDFFRPGVLPQYRPLHIREARRFLNRLLDTPESFIAHSHQTIAASIMHAVYGFEITDPNDKYIVIADRSAKAFSEVMAPGRFLVEIFPWLAAIPSWLPGAKFKRLAAVWKRDNTAVKDVAFYAVLDSMRQGTATPSLLSTSVENATKENGELSPEDAERLKCVAATAYAAGADTTFSTLTIFFLMMIAHPEVQRKAQAELDKIVGPDRLPDFSDRDRFVYVNAVLKEVVRWHSVSSLGLPHRSVEEDEYNGYRLPAGSTLVTNLWAMSRDEVAYPEADKFLPERFLKDGKLDPNVRDPLKFQFGFGRRVCPGREFSSDTLYITVVSILHAFNLAAPIGKDGKPVHLNTKIPMNSTLSHPEPFSCKITPRSPQMEALIRRSLSEDI